MTKLDFLILMLDRDGVIRELRGGSPQDKRQYAAWELTDEESTVLTALRTCTPVSNRFVQYRSRFGRELITVNRAWPISIDGEFLGVMDSEEDVTLLEKRAARVPEF